MAMKLTHLQLIYGVAGAREKFEELTAHLIRSERRDAERVRIVRGDGGIDMHEGELAEPTGVDVYQMKFFPDGVGESQKNQIRESFNRVRENTAFKTKSWTLCLPIELSIEEKKWFDEWKERQSETGIDIRPVWDAFHLEGLLYMDKNRHLRELYFREEHLTQIREMHGALHRLLDDFSAMKPKPIELEMIPTGIQILTSYKYPSTNVAVIDIEVRFRITNLSRTQTTRTWDKAVSVDHHDGRFVNRDDYPVKGFASYIRMNHDIPPTCSVRTEVHFGLRITLDQPLAAQLDRCMRLDLIYHAISENHVGDDFITPLTTLISLQDFVDQAERSLREAEVDFTS